MTEVQYRTTQAEIPHANLSQPLFILGIATGLLSILMYELSIRTVTVFGRTFGDYNWLEAAFVLGLVTVPLIFFALVWAVREVPSAIVFGTVGLIVCLVGAGLFAYYFPDQISSAATAQDDRTVLVVNVYLIGLLMLLVGLYAGHTILERRMRSLEAALREPTTIEVPGEKRLDTTPVPMGQVLDVYELEGVRRSDARKLRAVGVRHTGQLLAYNADRLTRETEIDAAKIETWQAMADLVRIDGIGPQFAALLVRAGVLSVERLADETPETLVQRVEQYVKDARHPPTRAGVDIGRARAWISEAQALAGKTPPPQTNASATQTPPKITAAAQ